MSGSTDAGRLLVRIEATTAQLRQQLQQAEQAVTGASAKIDQQLKKADQAFDRMNAASKAAQEAVAGLNARLGPLGNALGALGTTGIAVGAGLAVASAGLIAVAKAGDSATATLARLSSAAGGLGQAQQVYERLFQLSQQTGIAVADSAAAFGRLSVAAKEVGGTNNEVVKLIAGIQKAGIVVGATSQEVSGFAQQFGQALASGVLQGDELRSMIESMPQFAQALARELGVSIGQLKQMGSEGKLIASQVFPAALRAAEQMGAEFDKMPVTMSRAAGILAEATQDFGARLDRITGLSRTFAGFMQAGAAALNAAGRAVGGTEREKAEDALAAARAEVARLRGAPATVLAPEPEPATAAERRAAIAIPGRDPFDTTRQRFATPAGPRDAGADRAAALADALRQEEEAQRRLAEIHMRGGEQIEMEEDQARRRAAEAARASATLRLKDLAADLDARYKARKEYDDKVKKLNEDEARGATLPAGLTFDGLRKAALDEYTEALKKVATEEGKAGEEARKANEKRKHVTDTLELQIAKAEEALAAARAGTTGSREAAIALETEARVREAGIPGIEKRTEAEKRAAEAIAINVQRLDELKQATEAADEATKKAKEFHNKSWNELAGIGERAFDRLGDAIVDAFVSGEGAAVNFGNIAKGILGSVIADIAKLAVVNPILNSLFTSTQGARPTLAGAFGGGSTVVGAGGFSLSGLGNLSSIGNLFGAGGGLSLFGQSTDAALGAMGGAFGPAPASAVQGLLGAGGSFNLLSGSLTNGGVLSQGGFGLGGTFAGFGIGTALGSLVAKSQAQRTNSMIGAALGSILGGPLGGGLGGLVGGMIGPKDSVKGWGYWLEGQDGRLKDIDRKWYNETGAEQFAYADQQVAAVNAYLEQTGLTVSGSRNVGGNKNGPDGSWGGAASFEEAFADLRFSATDNTNLATSLAGRSFAGSAKLQEFVQSFTAVQTLIADLTAETVPAFTASITAVNDNFADVREQADKLGVSMDGLSEAQTRAIASLEEARTETLRQSSVGLEVRRLRATGQGEAADMLALTEAAAAEVKSFSEALDALAITAEDKANRLVQLETVQAAERAQIIARWGEQAASALDQSLNAGRNLLRDLAFGGMSALAPEQQYFAALSALNQAKRDLDAGGSLANYSAVASQVLPVARDFLGTSQRYGGLAAEVGQVLASHGADNAGLAQILSAQVGSTDALAMTFAAYGEQHLPIASATLSELRRLASAIEALMARKAA